MGHKSLKQGTGSDSGRGSLTSLSRLLGLCIPAMRGAGHMSAMSQGIDDIFLSLLFGAQYTLTDPVSH